MFRFLVFFGWRRCFVAVSARAVYVGRCGYMKATHRHIIHSTLAACSDRRWPCWWRSRRRCPLTPSTASSTPTCSTSSSCSSFRSLSSSSSSCSSVCPAHPQRRTDPRPAREEGQARPADARSQSSRLDVTAATRLSRRRQVSGSCQHHCNTLRRIMIYWRVLTHLDKRLSYRRQTARQLRIIMEVK